MHFTSNAHPTARCSLCGGNLHFNTALWMCVREAGQQIIPLSYRFLRNSFSWEITGFSRIMQVNSYTYIPLHFLIWSLFTKIVLLLVLKFLV